MSCMKFDTTAMIKPKTQQDVAVLLQEVKEELRSIRNYFESAWDRCEGVMNGKSSF